MWPRITRNDASLSALPHHRHNGAIPTCRIPTPTPQLSQKRRPSWNNEGTQHLETPMPAVWSRRFPSSNRELLGFRAVLRVPAVSRSTPFFCSSAVRQTRPTVSIHLPWLYFFLFWRTSFHRFHSFPFFNKCCFNNDAKAKKKKRKKNPKNEACCASYRILRDLQGLKFNRVHFVNQFILTQPPQAPTRLIRRRIIVVSDAGFTTRSKTTTTTTTTTHNKKNIFDRAHFRTGAPLSSTPHHQTNQNVLATTHTAAHQHRGCQ